MTQKLNKKDNFLGFPNAGEKRAPDLLMVQRWIKAASPRVSLIEPLSCWDCSKNHSVAGRGRRRNNVSVSKEEAIRHARSLILEQATAKAFLPHPLSPAERWKDPAPQTPVWFGFFKNASSIQAVLHEKRSKRKRGFPSSWSPNPFRRPIRHSAIRKTRDLNIPKTPQAGPGGCSGLEEQWEK